MGSIDLWLMKQDPTDYCMKCLMHIDECYCDLKQATDLELMKQEEARIRNEIEQGEIHE